MTTICFVTVRSQPTLFVITDGPLGWTHDTAILFPCGQESRYGPARTQIEVTADQPLLGAADRQTVDGRERSHVHYIATPIVRAILDRTIPPKTKKKGRVIR